MTDRRSIALGTLFALLGAIGFSAKAILIKFAYRYHVDAATLLALRMLLSLPWFVLLALLRSSPGTGTMSGTEVMSVVGAGLLGYYVASYLDFLGLEYITAGLERLILFLYPTLVVVIGAVMQRREIHRYQITALMITYAGLALALGGSIGARDGHLMLGSSLVFGSALAFAVYLIVAEQLIARLGSLKFTAYAMSVSSLACVTQFALTHSLNDLRLPLAVYKYALLMAICSTVLPALLVSAAIARIGVHKTSLVAMVGPVATMVLAYWLLDESISGLQIAGSGLVILGAARVSLRRI